MPRIRTIKPDFFHDPDLADCSAYARLAFIGLWCYADRAGRLKDEPRRLKGVLFPYEALDVEALLTELEAGGFIVRYAAPEGDRLIQIRTFGQHQIPHHREPDSTLPGPAEPGTSQTKPRTSPGLAQGEPRAGLGLAHAQPIGKGREGNGREGNGHAREGGPLAADVYELWREVAGAHGADFRLGANQTDTRHCMALADAYTLEELRPAMTAWWVSPHTGGRNLGLFVAQLPEVLGHLASGTVAPFRAPATERARLEGAARVDDWVPPEIRDARKVVRA